jgi:hypothetical protein
MFRKYALNVLAVICTVAPVAHGADLNDKSAHWAFRPPRRPVIPLITGHAGRDRNAIDAFVRQRLKAAELTPSAEADPSTLIRRVTLDLIGLPPAPDEVDDFLNDPWPGRYERLVDRLLASPQYGEKWARPWLDLCHYADTDGYLTDQLRPVAWRYRAWLVDTLNRNQPFDEFTVNQLAGDLRRGATINQRIATGFLRQTLSNREGGAEPEEFRVKQIVDRTEMVGTIWLGLTVGCARCHDHKYDPIEQREFFQLYACLNDADEVNIDAPLAVEQETFTASRDEYDRRRRKLIDPLHAEIKELQSRWEAKCLGARDNPGKEHVWDRQWELLGLVWGGGLGEGQLEGQEIAKLSWSKRTLRQKDDLLDYFLRSGAVIDTARFKKLELGQLQRRLESLKKKFPHATRAPVMQAALTPRQTFIHVRGDFRDRGEGVEPSPPSCLPRWKYSGEDARRALARWLVSPDNPLTARVAVNRMWQQFFGRGLVVTTEDFGTRGDKPSHPELLDWLACEFVHGEWDVKAMHRTIVCSATYRRSSGDREDIRSVDPENILLARQNALRVPAETVRDAGLAVSGLLFTKMGGPSVKPPQPERVTMEGFGNHSWTASAPPDCYRRGLYTFIIRTTPFAQAITFDLPNPNQICTRRVRSNTPLQALTLLNDPVFFEMAQALADRVLRESSGSDDDRIKHAFRLCLGRQATDAERQRLAVFLKSQREQFASSENAAAALLDRKFVAHVSLAEKAAWTILSSVLLNLHEFITRD